MLSMSRPTLTYYRAMCDRWRGVLALRITDWRTFWGAGLAFADRFRIASMALLPGGATIATSVEERSEDEFLHTTRVSWLGITFYASEEILRLDPDGRRATIEITARLWPRLRALRELGIGSVEVDEQATGAGYRMPWLGVELRQQTRIAGRELDVVQETDWSRAKVRLRRISG